MMSRKMFMVGAALALALTGCSAAPHIPAAPVIVEKPTVPVETIATKQANQFIDILSPDFPIVLDAGVRPSNIKMGQATCDYLDAGATVDQTVTYIVAGSPEELGSLYVNAAMAAIIVYCPQHATEANAWIGQN